MAKKHVETSSERRGQRKTRPTRGGHAISTVTPEDTEQQAFQNWVNEQLRRLYDPVLDEAIPESMLELLRRHRRPR